MTKNVEGNIIDYMMSHARVDLIQVAERLGIRYKEENLEEGLSGYLKQLDNNSATYEIVVNACHSSKRKRFTIAHELGHFFMHKHLISRSAQPAFRAEAGTKKKNDLIKPYHEVEANRFAAAILLPEKLVREKFDEGMNINEIAEFFDVSATATGYRLKNLGLI